MKISSVNASLLQGNEISAKAHMTNETKKFEDLVSQMQKEVKGESTIPSSMIAKKGAINGDFASDFSGAFTNENDKHANVSGLARNANPHGEAKTIDKTSELYKKSLELESYFVKILVSSMRNTVSKSSLLGEDSFANQMYNDMLYDEYTTSLTKNAGFGLADQIYLSLSKTK